MPTENAENAACVLALLHRILCLLWFLGSQKVEVTPQNSRGLGDACAVFCLSSMFIFLILNLDTAVVVDDGD